MSTFQESTGRVLDHFSYHDDPTNHLVDLGFDHSPNHSIVLGLDNMPIASFDQWQLEVCTVDEWVAHLNNDLLSSPPSQPEAQTVHEWDKLVVNDALPALPPPEIDFGDGEMIIEAIKSDGKLTCALGCSNVTFGRHIDVKRHHEAYHTDAVLWCPASDCPRNAVYGHYPFPLRKDKVRDHIRKMHKSDEEKQCWPEWFMQLKSGEKAGQTYKNNGRI
ncbi:hypothetical protein CC86DRAFT_406028 [Ophiobolus disseminans]|uniref:Uncharacterized protein n=1 Tax=Ophiobolus disseminans TaxID=1469910 RepID=A0A6A7A2J6_9PLEO|nr:hypothetical protein CC86DRAFT_406028 [Ophiobolus disseminans]